MISFNNIQGHDTCIKYIKSVILKGKINTGYLFSGLEGVGKALTAEVFIKALLCKQINEGTEICGECSSCVRDIIRDHPDVIWIVPEKNRNIKIEQIRKIKEVLNLKPFESKFNACVIEKAHMMTVEAANALLKVLEEPPKGSLIILISSKRQLLLPTIISRCSEIHFGPISFKAVREIVCNNVDISPTEAEFVSYFSQGSPGRAVQMVQEGLLERKDEIRNLLIAIVKEDNYECLNWDVDDKNTILEDIELLLMLFRDIVLHKEGVRELGVDKILEISNSEDIFERYNIDKISEIVVKLIRIKQALMGNVNAKLVAQTLPAELRA